MSTQRRGTSSNTDQVITLTTAQSWAFIEEETLGRLALIDPAGEPQIYPVNYVTADGALYIRTANDAKLRHLRAHPVIAFEIDGVDGGHRWSVVLRGEASLVQKDAEIRRVRATDPHSMNPTAKPFVIRLEPRAVTGRRFLESVRGPRTAPVHLQALSPQSETLPPSAQPPKAIPHFAPLTDD